MKLKDARAECRRWLAHLEDERKKTLALQEIASKRRRGLIDDLEARRRTQELDRGVTVYDASMLAEAVKVLLQATDCGGAGVSQDDGSPPRPNCDCAACGGDGIEQGVDMLGDLDPPPKPCPACWEKSQ